VRAWERFGWQKIRRDRKSSRPLGVVDILSLEQRDGTDDASPSRVNRNSARLSCRDACGRVKCARGLPLGSLPQVVMMQTADQWHFDHLSALR